MFQIDENMHLLESPKVTDRKKACEGLRDNISNTKVIKQLNARDNGWNELLYSVQACLSKDAEKVIEDSRKKSSSHLTTTPLSADVFSKVVRIGVTEGKKLDIQKLLGYINGCLKLSNMKKCYEKVYYTVTQDSILENAKCRNKLEVQDWQELLDTLKSNMVCNETSDIQMLQLRCLWLFFKWGPLSSLSVDLLRGQFPFMLDLCRAVSTNLRLPVQEAILDILIEFCLHTAKDNRVSCCKLGEDTIGCLLDLYELNGREDKVKEKLLHYFLLQIKIHHINGAGQESNDSYACHWPTWRKHIRSMYYKVSKEIDLNIDIRNKNQLFFIKQNNVSEMSALFCKLFVELAKQILSDRAAADVGESLSLSLSESDRLQKRQKLYLSVSTFITNIQRTKTWPWIHLVTALLKAYPNIINPEDYVLLLNILAELLSETKDVDVIYHIYGCLTVLDDLQYLNDVKLSPELSRLWTVIVETLLRFANVPQNDQYIQPLLQKFITKGKVEDPEAVLQNFIAGILLVTDCSLKTIEIIMQHINLSKLSSLKKHSLIMWLLNTKSDRDYKPLSNSIMAKVLVGLCLKHWPKTVQTVTYNHSEASDLSFEEITSVYCKTLFKESISNTLKTTEHSEKTNTEIYETDSKVMTYLLTNLKEFVGNFKDTCPDDLLYVLMLLLNVQDCMIDLNIIEVEGSSDVLKLSESILNVVANSFDVYYKNLNQRNIQNLIKVLVVLSDVFSLEVKASIISTVREATPRNLLSLLFTILNGDETNKDFETSRFKHQLRERSVEALVKFSCNLKVDFLTENQGHVLEALFTYEYNYANENDYELMRIILSNLKNCRPGVLPDSILESALESIRNICEERYEWQSVAFDVLSVLYDLYPHTSLVESNDSRNLAILLLDPFFNNRSNYGPHVSVALLKCLRHFCEIFSYCGSEDLVQKIPELLCSDYQEVRFSAIEALIALYRKTSESNKLEDFHKQEIVFTKVVEMSLRVFNIEGEFSQERRIDEVVNRTASVFQTFASLFISCDTWMEECLFSLLEVSYRKGLLRSVDKVLPMISNHFGLKDHLEILEKYLPFILRRWKQQGYEIGNFPFSVYQCDSKLEFLCKNLDVCFPLLFETEKEDLFEAAQLLDLPKNFVLQKLCPQIFANCVANEVDSLDENFINNDQTVNYLVQALGLTNFKQQLTANVDKVILYLLEMVTDERYIMENFEEQVIFHHKKLTTDQLQRCISYVEDFAMNKTNFLTSLLSKESQHKIEGILLNLKLKLFGVISEHEMVRAFHHYTIILDYIMAELPGNNLFQNYFIRDTVYNLVNLIKRNIIGSKINVMACKYFHLFLKKLLPEFSGIFEEFLTFVVGTLKELTLSRSELKNECLNILSFLIIENTRHLQKAIEKLDSFPKSTEFAKIRCVHEKVKYGSFEATLENEIEYFLESNTTSSPSRDSLEHLKSLLVSEKNRLKLLYEKLRDVRGFSEDCQESLLHRLVCRLVEISNSSSDVISFEAVKCLGELGPANLLTLILQPEKLIVDMKCSLIEMFCGNVISLLTDYIVDSDVKVVEAASRMLYVILQTKEGKKATGTNIDYGSGEIKRCYIEPFIPTKSGTSANPSFDTNKFISIMNDHEMWCPSSNDFTSEEWITRLVVSLLGTSKDNGFLSKLIPISKLKPKFCETLFPYLIILFINSDNKDIKDIISSKVNQFFDLHWKIVHNKLDLKGIGCNKTAVRIMLDMVNFIRLQNSFLYNKRLPSLELQVDLLKVSQAAHFCSAYFTAIFYAELWCRSKVEDSAISNDKRKTNYSILDYIYDHEDSEVGEALHNILRSSYREIGDTDALQGCGISYLLKPDFHVDQYRNLGQWNLTIHHYDMPILQKYNQHQLPLLNNKLSDETQYECFWRLSQWDVDETQTRAKDESIYNRFKYYSLKALHDGDEYSYMKNKKFEALCLVQQLKDSTLESTKRLYPIMSQIQLYSEMEDFVSCLKNDGDIQDLFGKWKLQDTVTNGNDFEYVEPIVAQRIVMLNILKKYKQSAVEKLIVDNVLNFAEMARSVGQFQIALKALSDLRVSGEFLPEIQLHESRLYWSLNDKLAATHLLSKLCINKNIDTKLRSSALKLSGQWMVESYSENRQTIIKDYFLESLNLMKGLDRTLDDNKNIIDTYDQLARFADREYQQVLAYINSDLFQRKCQNMEKARKTAEAIKRNRASHTIDELKAASTHEKQSKMDETEIENAKQEKDSFLQLALKYYLLNLTHSDANNLRLFRVISLFLENRNNSEVFNVIQTNLPNIPSYKYVIMLPQIIPHISENTDFFSEQINTIVEKCAIDHPHHTLPILLSIVNSYKDRDYSDCKTKTTNNDARISAASKIMANVTKKPILANLVKKLNTVADALIQLAYYKEGTEEGKVYQIPRDKKILKLKNVEDVLVPTFELPVSKNASYLNIVGISSFSNSYSLVGGVNFPKRITCRCTNGLSHSQLVKGQDDLRQDAVMEQVFTIINQILASNKQTQNLLIRTYKIMPLSMRSGILKWCDDTMPIGYYLAGHKKNNIPGAHRVFRPSDKTPAECRSIFIKAAGRPPDHKLKVYNKICEEFKPVFHKFFETSFPQPTIWYERRRAYIHSVATTSICGYILGIGDRHVNNILIDKSTAEVIHIDFGIALEQGRCLPTPETVPFRLTRDVVDGMGVSGVEGLFRRSCEKTMEVLRHNAQTITIILEVLLYDPLYAWTVTAAEANKRQNVDSEEGDVRAVASYSDEENTNVNIAAERALLRLRAKLQGTEEGSTVSIEHQVGTLIQQAVDPANLCKLFHGWQPYM